jgi:TRAP-type C4-dicarboxylate transport system substrate-binding protein
MMRKFSIRIIVLIVCAAGVMLSSCSRQDDTIVLKLAHVLDPSHSVHQGMEFMADRLDEYSGGSMRIDIYPSGQLGAERELVELVQIGSLAMT